MGTIVRCVDVFVRWGGLRCGCRRRRRRACSCRWSSRPLRLPQLLRLTKAGLGLKWNDHQQFILCFHSQQETKVIDEQHDINYSIHITFPSTFSVFDIENWHCVSYLVEEVCSMRGIRLQRLGAHILNTKSTCTRPCTSRIPQPCLVNTHIYSNHLLPQQTRSLSTTPLRHDNVQESEDDYYPKEETMELPSPLPESALTSAKLAALHARLALPSRLPLQTLARTLVDPTADPSLDFNNTQLASLGQALLSYHVSEWLVTTYPRLPMTVLFSAVEAYAGPATLTKIATEWGVETAAYPGGEVDPGLLQFSKIKPGKRVVQGASIRPDAMSYFRRGISSRVVYDDEFGDLIPKDEAGQDEQVTHRAYAGFVRALLGAIYLHAGSTSAKSFINAHILSRHLPMEKLFEFKHATRDLSRLCAREGFAAPVARLVSETGRLSRHPVFVVGIFSGNDKLGEGSGPNLDEARMRAAIGALKAWYLYSPSVGRGGRVPSDVEAGGEWKPVYIDVGEIV